MITGFNRNVIFTFAWLIYILLGAAIVKAATPALPQTMILNGRIFSSSAVTTRQNDIVTAYNSSLGDIKITSAKLTDNQGTYSLTITLGVENRDNTIFFTYTEAATGNVYELVDSKADNANRATTPFAGGGFPFPNIVPFDMYIGRLISKGSTQSNNTSGSTNSTVAVTPAASGNPDVNRDGKVDSEDVFIVNRVRLGFKHNMSKEEIKNADVNGDGIVNMADVIAIMRH